MSTTSESSALKHVLQCSFCKNTVKNPHTLQKCLHSYCKPCLDEIPKKDKNSPRTGYDCPACSNFTKEEDVRLNSFLEDLLTISKEDDENEEKEKRKICRQCPKKDVPATHVCTDCKIGLCDQCQISHSQIPVLKDHRIITLEKEKLENVIDKLVFCSVHRNKQIECNCKECETLICLKCNISGHNTHTIETITEAVDRLLPQLESNATLIKSNSLKLENQIAAIVKVIDRTKEAYASCRQEMDERLERLINRLSAIKAQMEDDIIEEESVALDVLLNIKLKLEHELSVSENLSSVVEVTTEKARQASLLNEIQNGLYKKVKEVSAIQLKPVDYKIKTPYFNDLQQLEGKLNQLRGCIGELKYEEPLCNVDTQGVIWSDNEYLCDDLSEIFNKSFTKDIEIEASVDWGNRLSCIDHNICLPSGKSGKIVVYNNYGHMINSMKIYRGIIVMRKVNNGDVIAAGHQGLFVTNNDFTEWNKLTDSSFSDICVHGTKFSVLEFPSPNVRRFALMKDSTTGKTVWSEEFSFHIKINEQLNSNSSLLIDNINCYIIRNENHVYYSCIEGELLQTYSTTNWYLSLCGKDKLGKLLIANYSSGEVYLIDSLEDLTGNRLMGQCYNKDNNGQLLRDVVIDSDGHIWYLEGSVNDFRLVKYIITEC